MLVRFIVKNLYSFNQETEFNVFPNKTQRLPHHKRKLNSIETLRIGAIYGANGSGKSNLIKSLSLLESMIENGTIINNLDEIKYKLNNDNINTPISFGIEFFNREKIYYYTLTFDADVILNESLYESKKDNDIIIFERDFDNNKQSISFHEGYIKDKKNKLFVEVLEEKLIQKNELLLSFLNSKYETEFIDVSNAFNWFEEKLIIIKPDAKPGGIADILDKNKNLKTFSNDLITSLYTGISKIDVIKERFNEFAKDADKKQIKEIIEEVKKTPDKVTVLAHSETGEEATLVLENNELFIKRLITSHKNNLGDFINFSIGMESDGTKRLIDYLPAIDGIISQDKVYIIDEIERSIHPITIKEIIKKISLDEEAKGQLIFTTHESCLLDQEILRPDEIWFAQKDIDGASKLYSLSEFNIHNTANIENGYLNGRYGGIPFLSNLKDLNWHKYEISE